MGVRKRKGRVGPRAHLLAVALFVFFGTPGSAGAQVPVAGAAVESFVAAFNRHDVDDMMALVHADIELFYISDEGVADLASRGVQQLRSDMIAYFADRPSVASRIVGLVDGSVYVSFREQIVGGQSSIAVYEVRNGLIRRVWYYPAEGPRS